MRIVLLAINAKYIHTSLSVRHLRGYASLQGIESQFAEYTINNRIEEIFHGVYKMQPDLLGISCYIWNVEYVTKLCTLIKRVMPRVKIFLGGPEVSYRPQEVLRRINADFVISGQGERPFVELVRAVQSGDYSSCSSLTYYEKGEMISNPIGEPIDMGQLAFPYNRFEGTENRICYYEAQRGCPFNCQYCLSSVERGVHFAPFEKVKRELKIFLDRRVRQVKFVDRTFNCNIDFAIKIVQFLIDNDNGVTNFHFEAAAELITDEFISLLGTARKGLFQLEIGVQSTNDDTLSTVKRHNDFERIKSVVKKIKVQKNVHLHLDLIVGLPKEDFKSFKNSFNMVHSLYPHQLQLGFLKILRGAGMEQMCEEFDIEYSPYPPYEVLSTSTISFEQMLYFKGVEEMVEIFYNSNRFRNISKLLLEKYGDNYIEFYADLYDFAVANYPADFLKNKNNVYIFLITFAQEKGYDKKKATALAKLDFILHERPRSSPTWAGDCPNLITRNEAVVIAANSAGDKNVGEFIARTHIERFGAGALFDDEVTYLFDYSDRDLWGNAKVKIV